jgi:amphi-Trp domain-containing protein
VSEKEEFEYSGRLTTEEASDYLTQIAEGLRSRLINLQGRGQNISLTPEDAVELEIKAERKDSKGKMEFNISWKEKYTVANERLEITSAAKQEETPES